MISESSLIPMASHLGGLKTYGTVGGYRL
jgi:hypothetical protein